MAHLRRKNPASERGSFVLMDDCSSAAVAASTVAEWRFQILAIDRRFGIPVAEAVVRDLKRLCVVKSVVNMVFVKAVTNIPLDREIAVVPTNRAVRRFLEFKRDCIQGRQ